MKMKNDAGLLKQQPLSMTSIPDADAVLAGHQANAENGF